MNQVSPPIRTGLGIELGSLGLGGKCLYPLFSLANSKKIFLKMSHLLLFACMYVLVHGVYGIVVNNVEE